MRAKAILRRRLSASLSKVHAFRRQLVFSACEAVIRCGSLAVTRIGRAVAVATSHKHGIKRADRLLGNPRLQAERVAWYRAIAAQVIGRNRRPIVLIDWTESSGAKSHSYDALVAAIPVGKRSIPIYSLVVPRCKNNNPVVHRQFLKTLQTILPRNTSPIIVTDAGFRTPWFLLVLSFHWDFVSRVRGGTFIEMGTKWLSAQALYRRAKGHARDLGHCKVTRSRQVSCRMVLARKRTRKTRFSGTYKALSIRKKRAAAGAREPWLLATNINHAAPEELVAIYSKRMAIEEAFRDQKSHRFGWSFCDVESRSLERIQILHLLASLATLVTTIVGFAAEEAKLHRGYQANTVRDRRVLSWRTLGAAILNASRARAPTFKLLPLPLLPTQIAKEMV